MRKSFLVAAMLLGCSSDGGDPSPALEYVPIELDAGGTEPAKDAASEGAAAKDGGANVSDASPAQPQVVVGAWNLHNFSVYGDSEYRIDAVASEVEALDADVLGVEELKVKDGTSGAPPDQAWDALLAKLPGHTGVHNPWNTFDTTVGVLLDNGTTTLVGYETIFDDDYFAFPRPPLVAQVVVEKADLELTLKVVVVHLKAKKAEYARRRAACQKLRAYMDARPQDRFVVIGDFNADPYDAELENSYVGTFLGQEPLYRIVTSVLPPESVTSLGWYHYVDGKKISGEFLDHVIVNAATLQTFSQISAMIVDKPGMSSSAYGADYSDHYPIVAKLTP